MLSYKAFHLKHFAHSPEHLEVKAFKFEHATLTLYFEGPFLRHTAGHGFGHAIAFCSLQGESKKKLTRALLECKSAANFIAV